MIKTMNKYVDIGFGKKIRIFGGKIDPPPSKLHRPYYHIHMRELGGKQRKHFHLGTDLELARKFVKIFYSAKKNYLHYRSLVSYMEMVKRKIEKNYTDLENTKIDTSIKDVNAALAKLRKTIKQKQEAP